MKQPRGLALILVLVVVLALALIATPFVLSMTKQEETATTARAEQQALLGAEGARNFAAYLLGGGIDAQERTRPAGVWSSPYSDGRGEFRIDLRDSRLAPLGVLDPFRQIWGVTIQDEQGKINVRSAPPSVHRRLQALSENRAFDRKDVATIYSTREARWIYPQRVRFIGNILTGNGSVPGVLVDDAWPYGRGARVRFTKPGLPTRYVVALAHPLAQAFGTDPRVGEAYAGAIVEVEARHPVNLNTASPAVLAALLEGLSLVGDPRDTITAREAEQMAARLCGQNFSDWLEVAEFLLNRMTEGSRADRLAALVNFMCPTDKSLDGTGTLPGCFVSEDTVRIAARGIVHTPAGTPRSDAGFSEIVDLGPPSPLARVLESQYDFDRSFKARAAAGGRTPFDAQTYVGYPFGNRVATAPNALALPGDQTLGARQTAQTAAFVQIEAARDLRGSAPYIDRRHHFDDTVEGRSVASRAIAFPWGEVFAPNPSPPDAVALDNFPDVAAGGVELWVRFEAADEPVTIFDMREGDLSNRLSLEWRSGELIFTASDATISAPPGVALAKGVAEIRRPFSPVAGTWYHVGAYWKGTRWGHVALLVDGFSDPEAKMRHVDDAGQPMITELAARLPAPAAAGLGVQPVALASNAWIPNPRPNEAPPIETIEPLTVPLLIGDEVVHYDKANSLVYRGMRGTSDQRDHPAGAKVQLFGYSSKLRPIDVEIAYLQAGRPTAMLRFNRLPATSASVRLGFGEDATAVLAGDKDDNGQRYIDGQQSSIPAIIPDPAQFPDEGYIRIEDEVIYYRGLEPGSPGRFLNCERGQEGTTAARHNSPATVELYCVPVTGTAEYLSPGFIQVEEEWFGPVKVADGRPTFWVGLVLDGTPLRPWRQQMGSRRTAHRIAEKVIPIFAVQESDPAVRRLNCQRWDPVTLCDAGNARVSGRIRRSFSWQDPGNGWRLPVNIVMHDRLSGAAFAGGRHVLQLVALWDHAPMAFVPDNHHVRLLKWPSGELPAVSWMQNAGPVFQIGPAPATVDEVKFFASPKGRFATAAAVDARASAVPMNATDSLDGVAGAVKIGDEIVGYAGLDAAGLMPATRGWLNSAPGVHAQGEGAFNLSFLPVSRLAAAVGAEDRELPIDQALQGSGYERGYALIDQEVVGFEINGVSLDALQQFDGRGLWRGRFGTHRASHLKGALVYGIPFRYWDTFQEREFDNRMAYYQCAFTVRDARWRSLRWRQDLPGEDPRVVTRCLVRADGVGEWFDPPARTERALLWEFTVPGAAHRLDHQSGRREAGQLEIRFYVEYLRDAFWPNDGWKRAPRIRQVWVEYERPMKVLFHEDD